MGEPEVKSEVGVGEKALPAFLELLTEAAKLNQSDLQILNSGLRVTPNEVMSRVLAAMVRAELRYLNAVDGDSLETEPDPLLDALNRIAEGQEKIMLARSGFSLPLRPRRNELHLRPQHPHRESPPQAG
jgi:hypothetical protein